MKPLAIFFRTRDILAAVIGLILLSPFLLVVIIWIRLDSEGPIFFRGNRVGKNGKIFKILKFRTMYENKQSYQGPKVTGKSDPRITKAGKWLRDTKLNEIPQLWNVLVGEMSLVGPRPEDPDIVKTWPDNVKKEILSVRPGITSPASVLYRDEEHMLPGNNPMDQYLGIIQPSKIRLDQLYVRHRSFLVDIDVIMWTFLVLMPGLTKYKPPERLLYGGVAQKTGIYLVNWSVIDFLVAILAISATGIFWRFFGPIDIGLASSFIIAIEFAIVFTVIGAVLGIQKIHWSKASPGDVFEIALSSIVATTVVLVINRFRANLPNYIIISASITTFIAYVIARFRFRLVTGLATRFLHLRKGGDIFRERVLIIGSGDAGLFAAWLLENSREGTQFKVVGFIDDDFQKQGGRVRGIPILGGRKDIPAIVEEEDIGIILFAIHNIYQSDKNAMIEKCMQTSAQLIMFPDVLGRLNSAVRTNGYHHRENGNNSHSPNFSEIQHRLDALKEELELENIDPCIINQIDEISTLIQYKEKDYAELLGK